MVRTWLESTPVKTCAQGDGRGSVTTVAKGRRKAYILTMIDPVLLTRFFGGIDRRGPDDCWLWTKALSGRRLDADGGYGVLSFKGLRLKAHRVAWEWANRQPVGDGLEVCHRCDTPRCCNPRHLFVASHRENQHDKMRKGRGCVAGQPFNPDGGIKLDAAAVSAIRARLASGETHKSIAHAMGVSRSLVTAINTGRCWASGPWGTSA